MSLFQHPQKGHLQNCQVVSCFLNTVFPNSSLDHLLNHAVGPRDPCQLVVDALIKEARFVEAGELPLDVSHHEPLLSPPGNDLNISPTYPSPGRVDDFPFKLPLSLVGYVFSRLTGGTRPCLFIQSISDIKKCVVTSQLPKCAKKKSEDRRD